MFKCIALIVLSLLFLPEPAQSQESGQAGLLKVLPSNVGVESQQHIFDTIQPRVYLPDTLPTKLSGVPVLFPHTEKVEKQIKGDVPGTALPAISHPQIYASPYGSGADSHIQSHKEAGDASSGFT